MLDEQKEQLYSLIDGELCDTKFIDTVLVNEEMQQCWQRYHIARDAMQDKLYGNALAFDISAKVAQAIELEDLIEQPDPQAIVLPKLGSLVWFKAKDGIAKLSQVGLAACITLGIIAGVQYQQNISNDSQQSVLNTVPVGFNVVPVGGISAKQNIDQEQQELIDAEQYNKVRLLVQDYELQRRINAQ